MKCQEVFIFSLVECLHERVDWEAVEKHAMDRISIRHFFFLPGRSLKAADHMFWGSVS